MTSSCRGIKIFTHTNIGHQLQKQRKDERFCDVKLKVENKIFNAHRNVLAAVSDYFLKMFTVDIKEKYNQVIPMPTVTARAVREILNSIYSGKMYFSEDSLSEILHAASLMQITDVITAATTYMRDTLSSTNCYVFKDLAILYSLEDVLKNINQFILQNIVNVSNEDHFLELSVDGIEELLKSDDLNIVDEDKAFEIVLKWVNKDIEERKKYFPQLFKHVRLQFIPIEHVMENIATNELVRSLHKNRNLIEETMLFHINPSNEASQKPRNCFASESDSLLFLSNQNNTHCGFNPASNQWSNFRFNNAKDVSDCAIASNYPMTVFCGGSYPSTQVIKLDGVQWMTLPSLNTKRCGAAAVFHESKLYVFGGERYSISKDQTFDSSKTSNPAINDFAKSFEILNEYWKEIDNDWQVRSYFSAQSINDKIYLIGGYKPNMDDNNWYESLCKTVCQDTIIYFPKEDHWKTSGQLNVARASFGCAVHQSSIYVVGGYGKNNSLVDSVEFKNQHDDAWTLCPTSIVKGGPMSACFVRNRMYVAAKSSVCKVIVIELDESDVKEVDVPELNGKNFSGDIVPFAEKYYCSKFHLNQKFAVHRETTYIFSEEQ